MNIPLYYQIHIHDRTPTTLTYLTSHHEGKLTQAFGPYVNYVTRQIVILSLLVQQFHILLIYLSRFALVHMVHTYHVNINSCHSGPHFFVYLLGHHLFSHNPCIASCYHPTYE